MIPFPIFSSLDLPKPPKPEWELREDVVSIFNIEWVTKTTSKTDFKKARSGDRAALAETQAYLAELATDWKRPEWAEVDWSKIHDMTFMELHLAKQQETAKVTEAACLSCPNFIAHVSSPLGLYLVVGIAC